MREYEVMLVLKPELEEEVRTRLLERVQGWLKAGQDTPEEPMVHLWGSRRLAYPIKNFDEGYYVLYEAKLQPTAVNELERNILYTEDILRHIIVRKEA